MKNVRHTLLSLLILVTAISQTGCSPTKGYPGPELPKEQVSLVHLSYDSQDIDVDSASTGGYTFGSWGISLLPGIHRFQLGVVVKEPPDHCYSYPQMDNYGYSQCLKQASQKGGYCDCYAFLTIRRKCFRQVHDGDCSIQFSTVAGREYDVQVSGSGQRRTASVQGIERGRGLIGGGKCDVFGQRTVTEDESVGSGRYTAYANGVYGCY